MEESERACKSERDMLSCLQTLQGAKGRKEESLVGRELGARVRGGE